MSAARQATSTSRRIGVPLPASECVESSVSQNTRTSIVAARPIRRAAYAVAGMAGVGGFTPVSPIWRITREWALMLGGGRALLLQAAHPLALAGVMEHSDYERDVWGRLRNTMTYVWGVVYGTPEGAEQPGRRVRTIHKRVNGTLPRAMGPFPAGTPYSAEDPDLLLWIHSTLVGTALLMYRTYVGPLSTDEIEGFWQDHRKLIAFIGVPESQIPPAYADFKAYWRTMIDSDVICVTPEAMQMAPATVMRPPLPV